MAIKPIRDMPDDAKASRVGLSRWVPRASESTAAPAVTVEDLSWFADRFADLADPDVMRRAWH